MTRAAVYTRVSTPGQEAEGSSLETQEAACRAYAQDHGYTLAPSHVYSDVHSGAELHERAGLTALRDAMASHEFDVLIAYAVDRLSREQHHLGVLVTEAERVRVRLEFVTEDFDTSAVGKFTRAALAFVGEVERQKIRERTMRGKRARAASGKLIPGPRPLYGYQWTEDRTAYVVDPAKAPIVARIFAEASTGHSLRTIAAGLMADGIPTPGKAALWWPPTVRWILRNDMYTGAASSWRYELARSDGGHVVRERPAGERIALPAGTVPPLIDASTFEAVRGTLTANKGRATRNNRDPERWLLRGGYVRCGHCGYTMHGAKRPRSGTLVYRCPRNSAGRGLCPGPTIDAPPLDTAVWARVEGILTDPHVIAEKLAELQANDPTEADAAAKERQIAEVARQRENLLAMTAHVTHLPRALAAAEAKLVEFEAHEERLRVELADILSRRDGWQEAQERLTDLEAWCGQVADRLGTLDYEQRRLALEYLGVRAHVWGRDHEPRYEIEASLPMGDAIVKRTP